MFLYIKGNTSYDIYYIINNIINQLCSKPALNYFALDGMRQAAYLGDVANATYPNAGSTFIYSHVLAFGIPAHLRIYQKLHEKFAYRLSVGFTGL